MRKMTSGKLCRGKACLALTILLTLILTMSCSDFMEVTIVIEQPIETVCVDVEASEFTMGSPFEEEGRYFDEDQRKVTLTEPFCISKYPITNKEFASVFPNKEFPAGHENHPVVNVTWQDAAAFARLKGAMLPTEAQWEYAARGGHKNQGYNIYSGSNDIDAVAWYKENSSGGTHEVGLKQPNQLGIYDMSGNVYEWTRDWYSLYKAEPVTDPEATKQSEGRIIRGGSWNSEAHEIRVADRAYMNPNEKSSEVGFRVVFMGK